MEDAFIHLIQSADAQNAALRSRQA